VPLVVDGRIFGAMTLYSTDPAAFDEAEARLLQDLADDLAFGIASLRLRAERQQALEALQASEERYRQIVETAEEGIWVLDEADATTFVNQKMAQMLGYSVEEMLASPILSYVDARDRARVESALHRRRAGIRERHDVRFRRRDGSELCVILAGTPIFDEAGRYQGSLKMATDITERKRLQRGIAEISSLEQQRIGRDLHDVLGQNITGISFLSKILEQKLRSLALSEAQEAAEIGRLAALTNRQARSLARALSPVDLTAANFEAKMNEFAAGVQEIFSIPCACECDRHVRIPDDDTAVHLFRIAQEAINNAVRHGHARNILIHLTEEAGRRMLMVQDDGCGMPEDARTRDGMGLQIMDYRASAIGGQLRIRSNANRGTVVVCSFAGVGS
jgi:PAS domain S-box-containing protein